MQQTTRQSIMKDVIGVSTVLVVLSCLASLLFVVPSSAKRAAKKPLTGEQVFQQYCSSCHLGGGNRVKESHPLAGSVQLNSMAAFKAYLESPPGHMPYYQQLVNDKHVLKSLYDYCKTLPKPVNSAHDSSHGELRTAT